MTSARVVTAGEVGVFKGGNGFPLRFQGHRSGDLPFFKVSDMNNPGNELFMRTANNYISDAARRQIGAVRIPAEAVVFAKVGAAVFLERKRILAQDSCIDNNMAAFIVDPSQVEVRFAHYLLSDFRLSGLVATTALPSLNGGQLRSIHLRLPSLAEQRAVTDVLSATDDLIDSLERLITKKRAIKQGMMQELLTGRTRLPGFTGEWRKRTIGDIATVVMGQSPSGKSYNTRGDGTSLVQGNADIRDRRTIDRVWTTEPTKRVRAGEVVLTVRAPVGCTAIAAKDACLGRGVCGISAGESTPFLFHALVAAETTWALLEQGSTFTSVNSAQVRAFELDWPDDADEGAAISSALSSADSEIVALERRLQSTRAIKQGMMQELLTGRTRLPVAEDVSA